MCKPPAVYDIHGYKIMDIIREYFKDDEEIECDFIIANYKTAKKTHEQMVKYYNSLDLFIHTGRYHLATPNPWFEAASCGIATIGTNNGCIPLITKNYHNGLIIDIHEKDDYSKALKFIERIEYLHLDKKIKTNNNNYKKSLCYKFGKNNRKSILNKWTWEKRALDWIYLFNQ